MSLCGSQFLGSFICAPCGVGPLSSQSTITRKLLLSYVSNDVEGVDSPDKREVGSSTLPRPMNQN